MAAAALIIGAAAYFFFRAPAPENAPAMASAPAQSQHTHDPKMPETSPAASVARPANEVVKKVSVPSKPIEDSELAEFKSLKPEEKKSLITLGSLLQEAIDENATMEAFVEKLDALKLKPKIMKDANEYTGEMEVVRTGETLPGTRYIHAQYFANKDGGKFPQHLSFELRPSKDSFEAAKKMVVKQFNVTGKPVRESANFASWKIPGRTVWVKRLEANDLNDPFNSYDRKQDVGTIRIGTELEIH